MFRVDCQGPGETTWASNALTFETEDEATAYAYDLGMRWLTMAGWRVVPVDHPQHEAVDYEAEAQAGRQFTNYKA